jgi:hypothetical protein
MFNYIQIFYPNVLNMVDLALNVKRLWLAGDVGHLCVSVRAPQGNVMGHKEITSYKSTLFPAMKTGTI